jgi:hypothetical protein
VLTVEQRGSKGDGLVRCTRPLDGNTAILSNTTLELDTFRRCPGRSRAIRVYICRRRRVNVLAPAPIPSLDEIATDPSRALGLSREVIAALLNRCSGAQIALTVALASPAVAYSAPVETSAS